MVQSELESLRQEGLNLRERKSCSRGGSHFIPGNVMVPGARPLDDASASLLIGPFSPASDASMHALHCCFCFSLASPPVSLSLSLIAQIMDLFYLAVLNFSDAFHDPGTILGV